jgi:hypothetical protein
MNDFNKETTYVISKKGLSHYIVDIGLFIDIKNGTTICKIDNSTFLSIKKEILMTKTSVNSFDSTSGYYGIGLFDNQDSLFYILHNKTETIDFLKNVDEILLKNDSKDISKQLNSEIISKME